MSGGTVRMVPMQQAGLLFHFTFNGCLLWHLLAAGLEHDGCVVRLQSGETLYGGVRCLLKWCLRLVRVQRGVRTGRFFACSTLQWSIDSLGSPRDASDRVPRKVDGGTT